VSGAWDAIGWTAQGPADYATDDSLPGAWRLPEDVETVIVSGAFRDIDGGLPSGYILFEGSSALTHVASGDTIIQPQFYVVIDRYGRYRVELPATDSPALLPATTPLTYAVSVVLGRKLVDSFVCEVPKADVEVSLAELPRV